MPHITLEYTNNLKVRKDFNQLFPKIHKLIAESLSVDPLNCKSRANHLDNYYIADGNPKQAFAHLQIKILDRHEPEKVKKLGEAIFDALTEFFIGQTNDLIFQPSVEINELKGELYFKLPSDQIKYSVSNLI